MLKVYAGSGGGGRSGGTTTNQPEGWGTDIGPGNAVGGATDTRYIQTPGQNRRQAKGNQQTNGRRQSRG